MAPEQGWHANSWSVPFLFLDLPGASDGKASDPGSIPGSGRYPGEEIGNALQYSCLENPTDRGAWYATIHVVGKSQTGLRDFTFTPATPNISSVLCQSEESLCPVLH